MKSELVVWSLLVAATYWLTSAAQAAEPFSLAGRTLGAPYESVLNDSAFDCDSQSGCFLYSACAYKGREATAFKGALIEGLTLYFMGERLSGIEANFAEGEFDRVVGVLTEEYGAGAREVGKVRAGQSTDDNTAYTWRQGGRLLRVERAVRPGRSSVIVAEKNFLSELLQQ